MYVEEKKGQEFICLKIIGRGKKQMIICKF